MTDFLPHPMALGHHLSTQHYDRPDNQRSLSEESMLIRNSLVAGHIVDILRRVRQSNETSFTPSEISLIDEGIKFLAGLIEAIQFLYPSGESHLLPQETSSIGFIPSAASIETATQLRRAGLKMGSDENINLLEDGKQAFLRIRQHPTSIDPKDQITVSKLEPIFQLWQESTLGELERSGGELYRDRY